MYRQFDRDCSGGQDPDLLKWHPCSDCKSVTLLPENFLAWEIFKRCWTQVITIGMGEVIGVNILAVDRLMDIMDVEHADKADVLDKVLAAHVVHMEEIRKKFPKKGQPENARQQRKPKQ
jgi:hypothetical protein